MTLAEGYADATARTLTHVLLELHLFQAILYILDRRLLHLDLFRFGSLRVSSLFVAQPDYGHAVLPGECRLMSRLLPVWESRAALWRISIRMVGRG